MLKILITLSIILISQLTPFTTKVQAAAACTSTDVAINYGNPNNSTTNQSTFFPENSASLTFEFVILNGNTASQLNGKDVYLHLPDGWFDSSTVNTQSVSVNGSRFRLIVDGNINQAKRGEHSGSLYWPKPNDPGKFEEYCTEIKYSVGTTGSGACTIDSRVPKEIPPGSTIPAIPFMGKANTDYILKKNGNDNLANAKTDNQGQGIFENVQIPGANGDTMKLIIWSSAPGTASCSQDLRITSTAPMPLPFPVGSVQPAPIITQCDPNDKFCTVAGGVVGIDGCTNVANNPGISTAIGCIHTNPTELVKDFMKFGVGIGGGLAFLMMLLGAFQMLTSAGNPETLNAGKERLTSAVIGLLFIIFAVLLLKIIGVDILGLGGQFGY